MEVFDSGTGSALYAAGSFDEAGGIPGTKGIARWNGASWSSVGGGLAQFDVISDLLVFDDGTGPALYAGGTFDYPNSFGLAKWDGYAWTFFAPGADFISTLVLFDTGSGPELSVGRHHRGVELLDILPIFAALKHHEVDYVLVGGVG